MTSTSAEGDGAARDELPAGGGPTVLDLVRLNPRAFFPPGGEALYRGIAQATELQPGQSLIDVACGRAAAAVFFARNYGVEVHAVDPDPRLVEEAEGRIREMGLHESLHVQHAALDDLPFQDGMFDVAIGEVGIGAFASPERAIAELARVTKPRGSVVLIELIWTGHVDETRRERLVSHLGARPLHLIEWKQHLRDAGIVDLHVEDWSDTASPFRPQDASEGTFADMLTLRQKLVILRRALQRWGWKGVRGAILREQEVRKLLTHQRVLGVGVVRGAKWE